MNVTPQGKVLPCHAAETIPGLEFWNARENPLADIWANSPGFNAFRGNDWMQEPCRSCERKADRFRRLPLPGHGADRRRFRLRSDLREIAASWPDRGNRGARFRRKSRRLHAAPDRTGPRKKRRLNSIRYTAFARGPIAARFLRLPATPDLPLKGAKVQFPCTLAP